LYGFEPTERLAEYLQQNADFMSGNIEAARSLPPGDPKQVYWYHVDLVLVQMSYIYNGYSYARQGTKTS
jgi:hypothetical protein